MIFDDIDDFDQIAQIPAKQSKPMYKTSLDSFFEEKQNEIENGNFLNIYDVYEIKVNENFIYSLKQSKQCKEQRKQTLIRKKSESANHGSIELDNQEHKERDIDQADPKTNFESDDLSIEEFQVDEKENFEPNSFRNINQISIQENLEINNIAEFEKKKMVKAKSLDGHTKPHRIDLRKLKSFDYAFNDQYKVEEDRLKSFVSLDEMVKENERIKADEEICQICYKGFELNDFIAKLKRCEHIFHKNCIDEWIDTQNQSRLSCLLCNTELN